MKMKKLQTRKEKDFEDFIRLLTKLEAAEFCGIAKMLKVDMIYQDTAMQVANQIRGKRAETNIIDESMTDEEKEQLNASLRPMEEIMNDMMDKFLTFSKRARKELLKIMKDCLRGR